MIGGARHISVRFDHMLNCIFYLIHVSRIQISFNLFLGWPWIHASRAIPSSHHQKVKFIHEDRVVTVQHTREPYSSTEQLLEISHLDRFYI